MNKGGVFPDASKYRASRSVCGVSQREFLLLAVALPIGWLLHDLVVFLRGGELLLVLRELLPRSIAGAVVLGWIAWGLSFGPRLLLVACSVLLVGSLLPEFRRGWTSHEAWIVRFLFLWSFGLLVGASVQGRLKLGSLRTGLALGALFCALKSIWRFDGAESETFVVVGFCLLLLGSGLFRSSTRSLGAASAVVLVGCLLWGRSVVAADQLPRPDLPEPSAASPTDAPNVLFVVLDTVRADRLQPYGHERVTTPNLDAFVREYATLYEEARSASPYTLSSHASLFTGLFPAEHGATVGGPAARPMLGDVETIAQRLRGHGYQTSAIVSNVLYLNSLMGFDRGFEHFDERVGTEVGNYLPLSQLLGGQVGFGHKYREAERISDLAVRWLHEDRRDAPFLLTLNYMDAHSPYAPPAPFDRAFTDEVPRDPAKPPTEMLPLIYDRELLYLDSELVRVFDALRELGLFENTVIVVTSDHGEAFGQHGIQAHCWTLYEELVHVPLYFKPAGKRRKVVEPKPICGPEVHDLILEEIGIQPLPRSPQTPPGFFGEWYPWPLLSSDVDRGQRIGRDMDVNLLAWLRGSIKTVVSSKGLVEAFDLALDPAENEPLPLSEAEKRDAWGEAEAWWRCHEGRQSKPVSQDGGQARRLRALGYGG